MAYNNYFDSKIREYNGNQDFVKFLKPDQIQRSAKDRIIREMVRGQIDYTKYGKYFLDPKFFENVYIAARSEYENACAICAALEYYDMTFPGNMVVLRNLQRYNNICYMYNVVVTRLSQLKETENIGALADIQYLLKDIYKFI